MFWGSTFTLSYVFVNKEPFKTWESIVNEKLKVAMPKIDNTLQKMFQP